MTLIKEEIIAEYIPEHAKSMDLSSKIKNFLAVEELKPIMLKSLKETYNDDFLKMFLDIESKNNYSWNITQEDKRALFLDLCEEENLVEYLVKSNSLYCLTAKDLADLSTEAYTHPFELDIKNEFIDPQKDKMTLLLKIFQNYGKRKEIFKEEKDMDQLEGHLKSAMKEKNSRQRTPLMLYCILGAENYAERVMKKMVEWGGDIHAQDELGNTALHYLAIDYSFLNSPETCENIINIFLDKDFDFSIKNKNGESALDIVNKKKANNRYYTPSFITALYNGFALYHEKLENKLNTLSAVELVAYMKKNIEKKSGHNIHFDIQRLFLKEFKLDEIENKDNFITLLLSNFEIKGVLGLIEKIKAEGQSLNLFNNQSGEILTKIAKACCKEYMASEKNTDMLNYILFDVFLSKPFPLVAQNEQETLNTYQETFINNLSLDQTIILLDKCPEKFSSSIIKCIESRDIDIASIKGSLISQKRIMADMDLNKKELLFNISKIQSEEFISKFSDREIINFLTFCPDEIAQLFFGKLSESEISYQSLYRLRNLISSLVPNRKEKLLNLPNVDFEKDINDAANDSCYGDLLEMYSLCSENAQEKIRKKLGILDKGTICDLIKYNLSDLQSLDPIALNKLFSLPNIKAYFMEILYDKGAKYFGCNEPSQFSELISGMSLISEYPSIDAAELEPKGKEGINKYFFEKIDILDKNIAFFYIDGYCNMEKQMCSPTENLKTFPPELVQKLKHAFNLTNAKGRNTLMIYCLTNANIIFNHFKSLDSQPTNVTTLALELGIDINRQDEYRNTALHYLILGLSPRIPNDELLLTLKKIMKKFSEAGYDFSLKNEEGKTALDMLPQNYSTIIINIKKEHVEELNKYVFGEAHASISEELNTEQNDFLNKMASKDFNINNLTTDEKELLNKENVQKQNLFTKAFFVKINELCRGIRLCDNNNENKSVASSMIKLCDNINAQDNFGNTVLHYVLLKFPSIAPRNRTDAVLSKLLADFSTAGFDFNLKNKEGHTPFEMFEAKFRYIKLRLQLYTVPNGEIINIKNIVENAYQNIMQEPVILGKSTTINSELPNSPKVFTPIKQYKEQSQKEKLSFNQKNNTAEINSENKPKK